MTSLFLILIVVVILTCVWLNNISARIGIPTLLAFIVLGIVFGNVGAIPVYLDNHGFAREVCTVALIFIMFYGGFGTRWETVKPVVMESVLLASLGVMVTAGLTGLFCRVALRWEWAESFLMGAVVSSTDTASVFSILRGKKLGLRNNTAPMLEMESGSNDPASYMLTAIMISVVAGKLDMLDAGSNVMKTFNDYSEGTEMQFSDIDVVPGSSWDGRPVSGLGLPKNVLIALVLREGERIIPHGDTVLQSGDKVILVTKTYEDASTYLEERTVRAGNGRAGHPISEFSGDGLILLVRRGDEEIIPNGDTVILEGDRLVVLMAK